MISLFGGYVKPVQTVAVEAPEAAAVEAAPPAISLSLSASMFDDLDALVASKRLRGAGGASRAEGGEKGDGSLLAEQAGGASIASEATRQAHIAKELRETPESKLRANVSKQWPNAVLDLSLDEFEALWEAVYAGHSAVFASKDAVSREAVRRLLIDHSRLLRIVSR